MTTGEFPWTTNMLQFGGLICWAVEFCFCCGWLRGESGTYIYRCNKKDKR